jgi:hypothetical protein
MIKGLPITAFKDGDILLSLDEIKDQWLFRSGELEKITNVASDFEIRKPLSNEMFYKMERSTGSVVAIKLHQAHVEKWITEEEHTKFLKMLNSHDNETHHLLNLLLDNRINELK